jgi:hypothetical protein
MNAEEYMKSKLDGLFFSLQCGNSIRSEPKVKAFRVPKDYIPRFNGFAETARRQENGRNNGRRGRPWTDEEDNTLMDMRGRGIRWESIGRELRRCKRDTARRYLGICAERGMVPAKARSTGPATLSADDKAEIVRLRDLGMTFDQISAQMGLKGYIARDYYSRFKHQMKQLQMKQLEAA